MPSPLVTHEFLETFLVINSKYKLMSLEEGINCLYIDVPDQMEKLKALNFLILTLPLTHSFCLRRILQFTNKVIARSEQNKMNLSNCSLVIAPNLFYTPSHPASRNGVASEEIQRATAITDVVKMLIKYHEALWVVSN